NGIQVHLTSKACPTPVVSYNVRHLSASGAVIITASHNPGQYNGFKIKESNAASASPEVVADIEVRIAAVLEKGSVNSLPLAEAVERGVVRMFDPDPPYLTNLAGLLGPDRLDRLRQASLHVAVDSMYGAGSGYLRRLLRGGRLKTTELNGQRNPAFPGIQPEPIQRNLTKLSKRMARGDVAVGLATDGDADRLGVVDENGVFITQLQVYAILAMYLLEARGQRGAIIKTITTSDMMYRLGEIFDCPVVETDVGFKYVGPEMIERDALIGGEESGGYGFRGHIPERDGILAGLYFLDFMVQTGKTASQLVEYLYSKVGPHYYDRWDLLFPQGQRDAIIQRVLEGQPQPVDGAAVEHKDRYHGDDGSVTGVRFRMGRGKWLLIRFSGTEPVLRVYAEAPSLELVEALLSQGRKLTGL
ncbi:MAG: phosphomannomutase, partial [Dehalococcoidia bacterium]|nr:phosphomannomutase [Dehalococcoidia bacterium]